MKECITHHHACDCREAEMEARVSALAEERDTALDRAEGFRGQAARFAKHALRYRRLLWDDWGSQTRYIAKTAIKMVDLKERAERAECEVRRWERLQKAWWDAGAVPYEVAARFAKHALRYRRDARASAAFAKAEWKHDKLRARAERAEARCTDLSVAVAQLEAEVNRTGDVHTQELEQRAERAEANLTAEHAAHARNNTYLLARAERAEALLREAGDELGHLVGCPITQCDCPFTPWYAKVRDLLNGGKL